MNLCFQCSLPICDSTYDKKNESAYALQVQCVSTIANNEGSFNETSLSAHAWLEQLYFVVNLTKYTIARKNSLFKVMFNFMDDAEATWKLDDGLPFAQSNNLYRVGIMQHVYEAWQVHVSELITACIDNNVSINTINPEKVVMPEAITSAFRLLRTQDIVLSAGLAGNSQMTERLKADAKVRKKWRRLQRSYLRRL